MTLLIALVLINISWSCYLTYLLYKKIVNQKPDQKNSTISNPNVSAIQKISLIRYNPYNDLGGNQSFVLAFLDQLDNGIVLTSLHSRDNTRVYAKSIKNGQGDGISLSHEEKNAILKAIKG